MLEQIFPGLGNLVELSSACNTCGCLCSSNDPAADDIADDKTGEKAPGVDPTPF